MLAEHVLPGTVIVDRAERIEVRGHLDDVALDELTAAVLRHGWDAVEVEGDATFRRGVAIRLCSLDPPVVVADNPLSEAELAAIVESSDDAILSKTLDGIITTWNAGAQRISGYEARANNRGAQALRVRSITRPAGALAHGHELRPTAGE